MAAAPVTSKRKRRRQLSPREKYEIYVSVLTGQATQREAADRQGVYRSTVVTACRVAKQARWRRSRRRCRAVAFRQVTWPH